MEYWGWFTTCTDWYQTTNYDPTPVYLYTSCTEPYYGLVGYGTECYPGGNGDGKNGENIDGEDGGRFFTRGDTLNIFIGSHGDADQLLHEMFHVYQYFKRTAHGFLVGLVNVEIEAHYAQYLYASGREDYKGSEWEERDNNELRRRKIKELEKLIDGKGELRPNRTESDLEIYILNEVIPVFQEVNAYKDYSLDYDRVGLDNFDTLEEPTTNY